MPQNQIDISTDLISVAVVKIDGYPSSSCRRVVVVVSSCRRSRVVVSSSSCRRRRVVRRRWTEVSSLCRSSFQIDISTDLISIAVITITGYPSSSCRRRRVVVVVVVVLFSVVAVSSSSCRS
jgi:hypothetical protein